MEFAVNESSQVAISAVRSGNPAGLNNGNSQQVGSYQTGSWSAINSGAELRAGFWDIHFGMGSGAFRGMLDIGVMDQSGSVSPIIENILANAPGSNAGEDHFFRLPIYIDSGTYLMARSRVQAVTGNTIGIGGNLIALGQYQRQVFRHGTVHGSDPSTIIGATVDPGGVANTYGAWTTVVTETANAIKYLAACLSGRGNNALTSATFNFDIGVGPVGAEVPIAEGVAFFSSTVNDQMVPSAIDFYPAIPRGSRVAARGKCTITDATDRLFDICIIGMF